MTRCLHFTEYLWFEKSCLCSSNTQLLYFVFLFLQTSGTQWMPSRKDCPLSPFEQLSSLTLLYNNRLTVPLSTVTGKHFRLQVWLDDAKYELVCFNHTPERRMAVGNWYCNPQRLWVSLSYCTEFNRPPWSHLGTHLMLPQPLVTCLHKDSAAFFFCWISAELDRLERGWRYRGSEGVRKRPLATSSHHFYVSRSYYMA